MERLSKVKIFTLVCVPKSRHAPLHLLGRGRSDNLVKVWEIPVSHPSTQGDPIRDPWPTDLMLPIGLAQPSLVLTAVSCSFLIAFSLTSCCIDLFHKTTGLASTKQTSVMYIHQMASIQAAEEVPTA
jgi:hypothetical protein